eukprot:scaffold435600_cov18-Prasinocladus_malaysianus.AAC.1
MHVWGCTTSHLQMQCGSSLLSSTALDIHDVLDMFSARCREANKSAMPNTGNNRIDYSQIQLWCDEPLEQKAAGQVISGLNVQRFEAEPGFHSSNLYCSFGGHQ